MRHYHVDITVRTTHMYGQRTFETKKDAQKWAANWKRQQAPVLARCAATAQITYLECAQSH